MARKDQSTAVVHYHVDHLGSIVKTTNGSGAVVTTRRYDPFGNLEQGATEGGYAFTGREWDPEIGLYYHRARYYDPKVGRFISEDPLLDQVDEINEYGYANNNPARWIDPFGLAASTPTPTPDPYTECRQSALNNYRTCQDAVDDDLDTQDKRCKARCSGPARWIIPWCYDGCMKEPRNDYARESRYCMDAYDKELEDCDKKYPGRKKPTPRRRPKVSACLDAPASA